MWTDTTAILTPIVIGAVVALVAIRLTFRNAANIREAIISPVVLGIAGALIGIAIGMIWLADREGRVTIDKGIAVVICGATLGTLAGAGAQSMYPNLKRGKALAFVAVLMLLAGSVGAPLGWILGAVLPEVVPTFGSSSDYDRALKQMSLIRMVWGIVIGLGAGLLLGLREVFSNVEKRHHAAH